MSIEFSVIKQQIIDALESRQSQIRESGIKEPLSLIDGFICQPIVIALGVNDIEIGLKIPMVVLLGKETGRIYLFALGSLIDLKE